jgi:hypothetical protein
MKKAVAVFLFLAGPLAAQTSDEITFQNTFLLRNISGTAWNPGPEPHHANLFTRGPWRAFVTGTLFATFSAETGPDEQRNEVFSTNWVAAGAQRTLGSRGLLLFRGRVSLEPLTIPEEGYPQMLQFVTAEGGGPLLDTMRPHDLAGEIAADLALRLGTASFIHLYVAPVGDPALGAVPFAQRASSEEFAEAPFNYDVQELTHDSTSVVTAGFGSRFFTLEASVFHDAVTSGRHTSIDSGDIDSRSVRLVLTPTRNLAVQVSRGELGDAEREISTASISYGSRHVLGTMLWSRREELDALSVEATLRATRNTFSARVETVERPPGFLGEPEVEPTTHFTVGYLFDVVRRRGYRAGVGVNFDYHTQSHEFPSRYGHKPQGLYAFVRVRTESAAR